MSVVANMFVIREINFDDKDNFMWSTTIKEIALKNNLWKENTPLDFSGIYSDGEYAHKYYSGRRM